jgi:hypothetical protein
VPEVRPFVLPVLCGAIAEGLIVLTLWLAGSAAAPVALLLLVEAGILGFVFGQRPGTVGAVAPVVVFGIAAIALADAGDRGADTALIVFVAILLGFTAWFVGALARRYGRP